MWITQLDEMNGHKWPSVYVPVDLRGGGYGVFLVHRDTKEWWRLIGVFSTWERARDYAQIENDCAADGLQEERSDEGKEEVTPAPIAELPAAPPSSIVPEILISRPEPAPQQRCAYTKCGKVIP